MADLNQLFADLGTAAANGASYSGATAEQAIEAFTNAFNAQLTSLNGQKADPKLFIDNAFVLADDVANLINKPNVTAFIDDLKKTESDISRGAFFAVISDLIADWKAGKQL